MKLGAIATGNDFYDRKTECSDLWGYLENDHVVASGPRRLGKSSIVNRLREEAVTKGLLVKHVDVQGVEGAQAFIDEISANFPDESVTGFLGISSKAVDQQPTGSRSLAGMVACLAGNTRCGVSISVYGVHWAQCVTRKIWAQRAN